MKIDYFKQAKADPDDALLQEAIRLGKVPETCLLGGLVVMRCMKMRLDPCKGCTGPRAKCHGRKS